LANDHFLKGTSLFLVGMMGSGKSTVGKAIAQQLGYSFVDTDTVIEQVAQKSIPEIFANEGEAAFRDIETQVLAQVASFTRCVVATGGGIITQRINWSYLQHGIVIWLKVPIEQLVARLEGDVNRPLLKDTDLATKLEALLSQRNEHYGQADVTIEYYAEETVEALATRILASLEPLIKAPAHPPDDSFENPLANLN
jgi:shikimate kinase